MEIGLLPWSSEPVKISKNQLRKEELKAGKIKCDPNNNLKQGKILNPDQLLTDQRSRNCSVCSKEENNNNNNKNNNNRSQNNHQNETEKKYDQVMNTKLGVPLYDPDRYYYRIIKKTSELPSESSLISKISTNKNDDAIINATTYGTRKDFEADNAESETFSPEKLKITASEKLDFAPETFIVLNQNLQVYRFSTNPSLFYFTPTSMIRRLFIKILTNIYFNRVIILTIILNCLQMTQCDFTIQLRDSEQPPNHNETGTGTGTDKMADHHQSVAHQRGAYREAIYERIFLAIYTIEMIVKIVARGFHFGSDFVYTKDKLNLLDLLIVVSSYLDLFLSKFINANSLKGLRALRIFRALKTIALIPGLKPIIRSLIKSLSGIIDTLILTIASLVVFSLVAVQLFGGDMSGKCMYGGENIYDVVNVTDLDILNLPQNCYHHETNATHLLSDDNICEVYHVDGSMPLICTPDYSNANTKSEFPCPINYSCQTYGPTPNDGFISFDNFYMAFATMLGIFTQDVWEEFYFLNVRSSDKYLVPIFYVFAIYLASFYLLNLVLAVVVMDYAKQREKVLQEEEKINMNLQKVYRAKRDRRKTLHQEKILKRQLSRMDSKVAMEQLGFAIDEEQLARLQGLSSVQVRRKPPAGERSLISKFCQLCLKIYDTLQKICQYLCHTHIKSFDFFIISCILINAIIMSAYHYPVTPLYDRISSITNEIFIWIFVAEMIIKIIADGPRKYFNNKWNIFDFSIVIISLVEKVFSNLGGGNLSVLRAFRAFRIFKLAKNWKTMNKLLRIISDTVENLQLVTLVLILVLFISSIVGMQFFGEDQSKFLLNQKTYEPDEYEGLPRWHMMDFTHSFLVSFRVFCGEWLEPMWDCINFSTSKKMKAFCVPFFICQMVIGCLIVLNLFLALLMSAFSTDAFKTKMEVNLGTKNTNTAESTPVKTNKQDDEAASSPKKFELNIIENEPGPKKDFQESVPKTIVNCNKSNNESETTKTKNDNTNNNNKAIIDQYWFTTFILATIIVSSVTLALEDIYIYQNLKLLKILQILDKIYTLIFTIEAILKLYYLKPKKYFSNAWNILDFIIVLASILVLITEVFQLNSSVFRFLKRLRTLRALRPARVLSRNEGTKVVIKALVSAIPSFFDVFVICMIMWVIFAIIGINLFSGKFYKCVRIEYDQAEILEPQFVYQDFERYLTNGAEVDLSDNNFNVTGKEENVIWSQKLENFKEFMREVGRDEYYKSLDIEYNSYFDGQVITPNYLLESYLKSRQGTYKLPPIDSKSMAINRLNETFEKPFAITKDTCLALQEASYFMNCVADEDFCDKNNLRTEFFWRNERVNFDDVFNALLALLGATFMGWTELMTLATDTTQIYSQPIPEANLKTSIVFFVVFVILGSFFTLNLYIGVIIESFQEQKNKLGKSIFKTEQQAIQSKILRRKMRQIDNPQSLQFIDKEDLQKKQERIEELEKRLRRLKNLGGAAKTTDLGETQSFKNESRTSLQTITSATINQSSRFSTYCQLQLMRFLTFLRKVFSHRRYESTVAIIILLNIVVMTLDHASQSLEFEIILARINLVFTFYFTLEILLKILSYTPKIYFSRFWFLLDFSIESVVIVSLIIENYSKSFENSPSCLLRLFRLARIMRILRLIQQSEGVRTLIHALIMSGPALANVSLLLLLVIYIFALFAMDKFAWVMYDGLINDIFNFKTFFGSFLTLFPMTTSAGWNLFLFPLLATEDNSDCSTYWVPSGINQTDWYQKLSEPNLTNDNNNNNNQRFLQTFQHSLSNGNCGYPKLATAFFIFFIFIAFMIIVNIYIAIILENYEIAIKESMEPISDDDYKNFINLWKSDYYGGKDVGGKDDSPNVNSSRSETYMINHNSQSSYHKDALAATTTNHYMHYQKLSQFVDELKGNLRIPLPNKTILCELNPPLCYIDDDPFINSKEQERKLNIHISDVLFILMQKRLAYHHSEMDDFFKTLEDKGILKVTRPDKSEYVSDYKKHHREFVDHVHENNVFLS